MKQTYSRSEVKTLIKRTLQLVEDKKWNAVVKKHQQGDRTHRKTNLELSKAHRVLGHLAARKARTLQPDDQATIREFPNDYHAMRDKFRKNGIDV